MRNSGRDLSGHDISFHWHRALWCGVFSTALMFQSCTISMTMVHTEGVATDVVDETQAPQNDIKPQTELNVSGLPVT